MKSALPAELFRGMRHDLMKSFEHDTNLLATEFDFYWKLTPKMQTELIRHLFESFLTNFSLFLDGCDG